MRKRDFDKLPLEERQARIRGFIADVRRVTKSSSFSAGLIPPAAVLQVLRGEVQGMVHGKFPRAAMTEGFPQYTKAVSAAVATIPKPLKCGWYTVVMNFALQNGKVTTMDEYKIYHWGQQKPPDNPEFKKP